MAEGSLKWPMLAKGTAGVLGSLILVLGSIIGNQVRENMAAVQRHETALAELKTEMAVRVRAADIIHAEFVRASDLGRLQDEIQRLSKAIEKLEDRLRAQELRNGRREPD